MSRADPATTPTPSPAIPEVTVPPHVQHSVEDGAAVLIEMRTGRYLGLDEVGTRMWTRLAAGRPADDVVADLSDHYSVDAQRVRADLARFVQRCCEEGVLQPVTAG